MQLFKFALCAILLGTFSTVSSCRSKQDDDRKPIYSEHGTEPPEPVHSKPKAGEEAKDAEAAKDAVVKELNPDDPDRDHEEGELQVGARWEFPVAQTKIGNYWGTIEESRAKKRILSFRGIPYAKSPEGPLRYQPPVPVGKHEGIKEVKLNGHVCPQHMYYKPDVWIGQEDCLWLNVFTRDLVVRQKRPVMVWIHGGNFVRGSAADYEPDYLLDEDVVLVTIQYRLGMFGFLSTEDEHAAGNFGMLDQVLALQWVKQNIEAFSGDPNRITIMGQQAGGASVHYHILSPLSRGLFHQAVSMSGTALCWWASIKRPLEKARKLARLLKCPKDNHQKMVECFRLKSMEDLMNTHPNFYEWRHLEQSQEPLTAFSPRVDPESKMSFMPKEPIDFMRQGNFQHIPWIVGMTDDEGAFKASAFFTDMKAVREFESEFEKLGPLMFGLHDGQSEAPKVNSQRVRDYYWGTAELDKDLASKLVNAISDSSYSHPIDTAAKVHAMKSNAAVFVYHFGYRGRNSLTHLDGNQYPPKIVEKDISFGVGNGDDLMYVFPILGGIFRPLPHEDLVFSQRIIHMLANFAREGKPYIKMGEGIEDFVWDRVMATNATHLNIGNEMKMDLGLPNNDRMNFWQQMPVYWNANREGYKPAPPIVYKDEL